MTRLMKSVLAATAIGGLLSACGGGGGGSLASVPPPPPPSPAPAPAPGPGPSPLPAQLGLVSDQPFATAYASPRLGTGEDFQNGSTASSDQNLNLELRYLAGTNTYEITLPRQVTGRLEPYFSNGDFTASNTVPIGGTPLPDGRVHLPVPGRIGSPYTYTSFGYWNPLDETPKLAGQTANFGLFVYGIPTRAGEVPVTGQASFSAAVMGYVSGGAAHDFVVSGSARLNFDFAAGQLRGAMNPTVPESGWAGFASELGTYTFTQTVFSTGSTKFSGSFTGPNLPAPAGSFSGTFTGSGAAELMARFNAPFLNNGVSGSLVGVWIGKRD